MPILAFLLLLNSELKVSQKLIETVGQSINPSFHIKCYQQFMVSE